MEINYEIKNQLKGLKQGLLISNLAIEGLGNENDETLVYLRDIWLNELTALALDEIEGILLILLL